MVIILIGSVISTKVLSSRPSARLLESAVADATFDLHDMELAFDLRDKFAMAPAFLDELIRMVVEQAEPMKSGVP